MPIDNALPALAPQRRPTKNRWLLAGLAGFALLTPGCGGCRTETPQERAAREQREEEEAERRRLEEEKKKKKPPLEVQPPSPQPSDADRLSLLVKPGHWMTATQRLKPNYEDWVGLSTLEVVDKQNQPIAIDRTAFALRSSRDLALSKGQEKQVESVFFVPSARDGALRSRSTLRERGASLALPPLPQPLVRMAPHQQHFVILGKEPQRYAYIGPSLRSIQAPLPSRFDNFGVESRLDLARQYRVVAAKAEERVPLSENPLCWTSVAYLLWDEVDPELLSPGQRVALVDWLHWGGQLLVSGPDSLDLLQGSFLEPYLPADNGGARNLTAADLAPLSEVWAASRRRQALRPVAAWSGVKLARRPGAEKPPQGADLFAERRVGRGRVIVSAMQLAERDLINWADGFENLFNNLLLRRPSRHFAWDDVGQFGDGQVYVRLPKQPGRIDARGNSKLRYFARDTLAEGAADGLLRIEETTESIGFGAARASDRTYRLEAASSGGPAAWSDFNAVATAARGVLREAAGVNVPGSGFVVACLGIYLTVLAPLNWFVFRALGRVEFAWVAAPLIAILGTWVVVRQAQLDIGFVRAQTEIAVLETQPNHPRGHLTRYLSFYTSLSTTYDVEFDEPTAVAAPFARGDRSPLLPGEQPARVTYQRQEKARLLGLGVSSNSTDMIHAEQMIDLGGALKFDPKRNRITNESDRPIRSLAVVRRPESDPDGAATLRGCWVGELAARSSTSVSFAPLSWDEESAPFAAERGDVDDESRLNFEPLFALALDPNRMERGEVRAVGRLQEPLPGVTVTPSASQLRGATVLVAHLQYGPLSTPAHDANAPIDVLRQR